MIGAVRHWT